jgi:hypothetical protein
MKQSQVKTENQKYLQTLTSDIKEYKTFDELSIDFYNARKIDPKDKNKELKEVFNNHGYKQLVARLKEVKNKEAL